MFFLLFFSRLFVTLQRKVTFMQDIKEATSYRTALREPIMEIAMKLFTERGIKAVKMDDIAQQLGISKRTLYEVYEDKEKLLYQGIVTYDRKKRNYLEQYARQGHHVIDIIIEAYRMKVNETRNVNPLFYEDIMKYPKVELYIKEPSDIWELMAIQECIDKSYSSRENYINSICDNYLRGRNRKVYQLLDAANVKIDDY